MTAGPGRRLSTILVVVVTCWLGLILSGAGATAATSAGTGVITANVVLHSGGQRRTYLLVRPTGPTTGLPLLVELHGYQALPSVELARSGFLPLAQQGKAVLAFPAGYGGSWNTDDKCCGPAYKKKFDDVRFVHDVVSDVESTYHTKTSRTYLVGFSNGGKLAMTIACVAPQGFTAFAEYGANPDVCPKRVKAPYFLGAGGRDPEEPVAGKPTDSVGPHPPLSLGVDSIRTRNGCHGSPYVNVVGQVRLTSYVHCATGSVVSAVWQTNDHRWPSAARVGAADSAATLMWSFLYSHQS